MKLWNKRVLCDLNAGERWHEVAERSPPARVQPQGPWETNTNNTNQKLKKYMWYLIGCVRARTVIQLVFNSVGNTRVDIFLPHSVDMSIYIIKEWIRICNVLLEKINQTFTFLISASNFYLFYVEKSGKLIWKYKWKRQKGTCKSCHHGDGT